MSTRMIFREEKDINTGYVCTILCSLIWEQIKSNMERLSTLPSSVLAFPKGSSRFKVRHWGLLRPYAGLLEGQMLLKEFHSELNNLQMSGDGRVLWNYGAAGSSTMIRGAKPQQGLICDQLGNCLGLPGPGTPYVHPVVRRLRLSLI